MKNDSSIKTSIAPAADPVANPSAAATVPSPIPAAVGQAPANAWEPFFLGISGLRGNVDERHRNVAAYQHEPPPTGRPGGIHVMTVRVCNTDEAVKPALSRAQGRNNHFELDVLDSVKASKEHQKWDAAANGITTSLQTGIGLRQKVAEAEAARDAALATATDAEYQQLDSIAGPLRNRIDRLCAERAKLFDELPALQNDLLACAKQIVATKAAAAEAVIKPQLDDLCGLLSGNTGALDLLIELDEFGKQIRFAAVSLAPLIVARITAPYTANVAAIAPPATVPNVFGQPVSRAVRVGV